MHLTLNQVNCLKRSFSTTLKYLSVKECRATSITDSVKKTQGTNLKNLESPKVVIVGAGIAGLSAAAQLIKSGISDVVVLEATERPGGRIYSCWLGNTVAEVGCQWIPNSISNSVLTLATQEGILDEKNQYRYDYSSGIYMTSDGRVLDKLVSSHAYLIFRSIEKQAYGLYKMGASQGHGSLMNFFSVRIEQELHNFPKHQRDDAARIMYGMTNKISNRWGADLDKLSADLLGTYNHMTVETLGIPLGFVGVLAPLIRQIPVKKLLFSKIVECIRWENTGDCKERIIVTTCDRCRLIADYVIVTFSLGVLKREAESIFSPCLPREKMDAIKNIGFGNISKIFIEYKNPFWIAKQGPIKLAWAMNELSCDPEDWINGLNALEELPGSKHILLATVSGKFADKVEKLGDVEIAKKITDLLRKFTKDPSIPYPDGILRSKWKTSPFFCGTNAYMGLKSTPGHLLDLAAPVPNNNEPANRNKNKVIPALFFAGEATCPKFFSSVHGARQSGLKAATEIINLTKKLGGRPPVTIEPSDECSKSGEKSDDEDNKEAEECA